MDKWTEDIQMAIDLAENCNDPASEFHGNSPPDTSKSRTRKGGVNPTVPKYHYAYRTFCRITALKTRNISMVFSYLISVQIDYVAIDLWVSNPILRI